MPQVWFNSSSRDYEEHPYGGKVFASRALIERYAERPHPAIDDGAAHRPVLIGKRAERIGVDALEVERATEVFIVGEGVGNVLLSDGVPASCQTLSPHSCSGVAAVLIVLHLRLQRLHVRLRVGEGHFEVVEGLEQIHGGVDHHVDPDREVSSRRRRAPSAAIEFIPLYGMIRL